MADTSIKEKVKTSYEEFLVAQDLVLAEMEEIYKDPNFLGSQVGAANFTAKRVTQIKLARMAISNKHYGYCTNCHKFLGFELLSKAPLVVAHAGTCPIKNSVCQTESSDKEKENKSN